MNKYKVFAVLFILDFKNYRKKGQKIAVYRDNCKLTLDKLAVNL